jgi:hypothetical protein
MLSLAAAGAESWRTPVPPSRGILLPRSLQVENLAHQPAPAGVAASKHSSNVDSASNARWPDLNPTVQPSLQLRRNL